MKIFRTKNRRRDARSKLLSRNSERKALTYILTVNIVVAAVIMIANFSLPRIIEAYSVSHSNKTEYEADTAEYVLNSYRNTSLAMIEETQMPETIEDFFNFFPQPEYPEDVDFYELEGWFSAGSSVTRAAWKHAYDLYYSGKIHGASLGHWCTLFAQMWFYDMFGFNSSGNSFSGDGVQFANVVYDNAVWYDEDGVLHHYFEYGDKPMTMGIISIKIPHLAEGHVICVDNVDYFKKTITISEGNATGNGDIRIRTTMSFDRFYALYPGQKTYINPTPELIALRSESKSEE